MGERSEISIATWNVRTLANKNDKSEENFIGKLQKFELQFEQAGLDIIALQETHVRTYTWGSGTERILGTKINKEGKRLHRAGVAIAVKNQLVSQEFRWHPISERIAWLEAVWEKKFLAIIVVYAPTLPKGGMDGEGDTAKFYESLAQVIRSLPSRWAKSFIILGDFNRDK
jgi:exonuclease III